MSLVREPDQIALFNTEKVGEESFENGPLRVDHFATSVKMSTYLVAFVVCDFANRTKLTKSGIRVWIFSHISSDHLLLTIWRIFLAEKASKLYAIYDMCQNGQEMVFFVVALFAQRLVVHCFCTVLEFCLPRVGQGCRIDPLHFLAGWRKRRLNQAFSFV